YLGKNSRLFPGSMPEFAFRALLQQFRKRRCRLRIAFEFVEGPASDKEGAVKGWGGARREGAIRPEQRFWVLLLLIVDFRQADPGQRRQLEGCMTGGDGIG